MKLLSKRSFFSMETPEPTDTTTLADQPQPVEEVKKPAPKSKRLIAIIVGVLVLAVAVTTFALLRPKENGSQVSASPSATATVQPEQKQAATKSPVSEEDNSMGQDDIIQADMTQNGPWKQSLQMAESKDGKTFGAQKAFQKGAGVATAVRDQAGVLYAAFQYFPENDPQNFDKIAIKKSTDGGVTWSDPIPAVFSNYPKSYMRPFDPTLALTPEGKIRMYYTSNTSSQSIISETSNSVGYYSSISSDGITYEFEEGKRLSVQDKNIIDSAVAYHVDKWYLIAPTQKNFGDEGIYYTSTSSDGLTFAAPTVIPNTAGYEWTGNMVNVGSTLRFYGSGQKIFYSEAGADGTWGTPVNTNLAGGGDPAVVQAGEGKYIAIFSGPGAP